MWIDELDKLAVEVRKDLDKYYNFSSSNYNATDIDNYKPLPPPQKIEQPTKQPNNQTSISKERATEKVGKVA